MRATTAGTTRFAAISVTPMTFIVASTVADSKTIRSPSTSPVRTPVALATSVSNVVNNSCRYPKPMNSAAPIDTATISQTSAKVTPRTLPKSRASAFWPGDPYSCTRARPSANDAVVTTPIAASEPIGRRRTIPPIANAVMTPQAPAPRNRLIPIRPATA